MKLLEVCEKLCSSITSPDYINDYWQEIYTAESEIKQAILKALPKEKTLRQQDTGVIAWAIDKSYNDCLEEVKKVVEEL